MIINRLYPWANRYRLLIPSPLRPKMLAKLGIFPLTHNIFAEILFARLTQNC